MAFFLIKIKKAFFFLIGCMKCVAISRVTDNPVVNLALDTIRMGKQALVFLGTRPSAEKAAEDVSKRVDLSGDDGRVGELAGLKDAVLQAVGSPTKQCVRLAGSIGRGVAFHHSGLTAKQREIVEDGFRKGVVRIICATPTLSAGVDLPAYRTIIRDLKRFTAHGYDWIPVLEYLQMAGRAGRPKFDSEGQAIVLANSEGHADELVERFIEGEPEVIYSKLAVEPVLRTYVLSLISSRMVAGKRELLSFFEKTFWAHQFGDMERLEGIIDRISGLLEKWGMITVTGGKGDFVSASEIGDSKIRSTRLGSRVSELYVDPLTANDFVKGLSRGERVGLSDFNVMQLVSCASEFRPLLRVKKKEQERVEDVLVEKLDCLLTEEPSVYDSDYDDFMASVKTTLFFMDWMDEKNEEQLFEAFDIRPGEIRAKLSSAEWLLHSVAEIAKVLGLRKQAVQLARLRIRVKNGVREELLPLLQLKGIGRVRSRRIYDRGLKTLSDVKKADSGTLTRAVGSVKVALSLKKQLGQEVKEVSKSRRKGQMSVSKY